MRVLIALYLLTVTASLALPVVHERCHLACEAARDAARDAAQADVGSNYKQEHKRAGVSAAQQIKRDRERLALLITEQAITREIARTKGIR